jgi:hypothetical protein
MALHNILKLVVLVLGVIALIMGIWLFVSGNQSLVQPLMYIAYIVLFATIALVLLFVIKGLFTGDIKKTLLSVGVFAGIFIISYFLASGTNLDLEPFIQKGSDITEAKSKMVGTGLIAFYIFGVLAILSMVYSGVTKATNR